VGFVHHATGILLGVVVGFFKILVASNSGTDVEGELGVDDMVNGISKGGEVVKDDNLMVLERGAGIISRDDLQDTMVNRVTFSKGCIYFGVVRADVIIEEGGNNKIAGRWIRNGEPIVRGGEQVI
jgi:hypothetical protein